MDNYTQVNEIIFGNVTIRVHKPELTNEEKAKRELLVINTLQNVGWELVGREKK